MTCLTQRLTFEPRKAKKTKKQTTNKRKTLRSQSDRFTTISRATSETVLSQPASSLSTLIMVRSLSPRASASTSSGRPLSTLSACQTSFSLSSSSLSALTALKTPNTSGLMTTLTPVFHSLSTSSSETLTQSALSRSTCLISASSTVPK